MLTNAPIPQQPLGCVEPEPPTSSITRALCAELIRREQVGTLKYGRPLRPFDNRRTLVDALEESLDMAVYLKKAVMEQEMLQHLPNAPQGIAAPFKWVPTLEYNYDINDASGTCIICGVSYEVACWLTDLMNASVSMQSPPPKE